MSKLRIFVSATFVLIFVSSASFASPQDQVPDAPKEADPWPTKPPDENLSISDAPRVKGHPRPADPRYYPYQQALTFRYGQAGDLSSSKFNDNMTGFQYLFPKFLSPKLEAGADLHDGGKGHIHAGARWIAWERSYFRPSAKVGLDHLVDSSENLATFAKIENLYVRATATLEYVMWNPYSVRLEGEILVSTKTAIGEVTLGLSRGW